MHMINDRVHLGGQAVTVMKGHLADKVLVADKENVR